MSRHATCPYRSVPDFQRWDRAFAKPRAARLDPYAGQIAPFKFTKSDRIATVGSCFAQNISQRLIRYGYDFLRAEYDAGLTPEDNDRKGNSLFSARYGNVYTVLHLVQLIDQALGRWQPREVYWEAGGRYLDPFRPSVDADGFASPEELAAARAAHLAAVRRVFEQADVLVFTLGLTEGWVNRDDGAAYPICPGCGYGTFDPARYEFRNFSYAEICASLSYAVRTLKETNPKLRIILTVSPVPLAATLEERHVLLSTALSKSVLRAACDAVVREHSFVDYFGSYEIVNFGRNMTSYFTGDLRAVSDDGIDHVMEVFFRRYCGEEIAPGAKFKKSVCDEDLLLPGGQDTRISTEATAGAADLAADDAEGREYRITQDRWPHPATLWRGKPGAVTTTGKQLDSLGFHNRRPITEFMAPHQRRICVIGNSAVAEFELEPEQSIVGHLQNDLWARGFKNTHVSNCGILGAVSHQDLSNLLHNVIDMQPSIVVVITGGVEFHAAVECDPRPGYPRTWFLWEALLKSFRIEEVSGSPTARLVDFEVAHGTLRAEAGYMKSKWFNDVVGKFASNVSKIAQVCEGFRLPCVLINQPSAASFKLDHDLISTGGSKVVGTDGFFEIEAMLRSQLFAHLVRKRSGGYVLFKDFAGALDHFPESPFVDRLHMTSEGNAAVAHEIRRAIEERFLSFLA